MVCGITLSSVTLSIGQMYVKLANLSKEYIADCSWYLFGNGVFHSLSMKLCLNGSLLTADAGVKACGTGRA